MSLLVILSSVAFLGWLFFHKPVCSSVPSWILEVLCLPPRFPPCAAVQPLCCPELQPRLFTLVRRLDSVPLPFHSAFRKPCLGRSYGRQQFMGLQRVGHDWVTELNWWHSEDHVACFSSLSIIDPHCYMSRVLNTTSLHILSSFLINESVRDCLLYLALAGLWSQWTYF